MALDTANKRFGMINAFGSEPRTLYKTDASGIAAADASHFLNLPYLTLPTILIIPIEDLTLPVAGLDLTMETAGLDLTLPADSLDLVLEGI